MLETGVPDLSYLYHTHRYFNTLTKLLVTGATGFLGRHLLRHLKSLEGLELYTCSIEPAVKAYTRDWIKGTTYISADLYERNLDWYDTLGRPDSMIHLAWQGLPNYKEDFHFTRNLPCDYALLKEMVQSGLKSLTVAGTCFEYGMTEGCLTEDMYTQPDNPYALAKDTLRKSLEILQKKYPFSLKWPRLFYMYGEGQNPNALLAQLQRTIDAGDTVFNMSGGEQVRDYLAVEQMAKHLASIALQDEVTGIINTCEGKGTKVIDIVNQYLHARNATVSLNKGYYPYPDFEPFAFWGDDTKLKLAIAAYEHTRQITG
jgi:nucleoside-diphosphate-sugar epimerase